ncbi:translation elongation factor 1-alpha [Rozella allomycis CSF55]|uniref:Translation elongation factor 1-alpha n=1 Tax=Rozella allomycis (strain CSF55) TaxID=988480 RepID=A0A4P9YC37_ROZAC|nr:translation elongation factor 1-alpha [Rozella allomycis CSF55]
MPKERNNISIVLIGDTDSGKSTIAGHLVYACGGMDAEDLAKYEDDAIKEGFDSLKYSWVINKKKRESNDAKNISTSLWKFETSNATVTLSDVPGHDDFLQNLLTTSTPPDCAMLVLSAMEGEFEAGISENGHTKEHVLLTYTLGIKQLIVIISKMDTNEWSMERFEYVSAQTKDFLSKIGYNADEVPIIPVSGWHGDNLVKPSNEMKWFEGWTKKNGKTLLRGVTILEAIDSIFPKVNPIDNPLRISLQDIYKTNQSTHLIPVGKIGSGILKKGMTVKFSPSEITSRVETIQINGTDVEEGVSGDIVSFEISGVSIKNISRGFVVSNSQNQPSSGVISFIAQIIVLNHPKQLTIGYTPVVDVHNAHLPCQITHIMEKDEISFLQQLSLF